MASETDSSNQFQSSFIQRLLNSSNSGIPLLFPFIFGSNSTNPPQETQDQSSRDRVIIFNPLTQSMIVMGSRVGSPLELESLFGDLVSTKSGPRSASKAAIDALPSVGIAKGESDDDQCVVCLEEWEASESAKEMPCKHRFHGNCIEKWLKINGSCPVCRFEMPVDEDEDANRKTREENGGERSRGIWLTINFGGSRRNDQNSSDESSDSPSDHQETFL